MLKIRLQRVGRKHEPSFRLVLTDSKNSTKSGRLSEVLGSYDPRKMIESFNTERIKHWLARGAGPTASINNLLIKHGIIRGKKIHVSTVPAAQPTAEPIAIAEEPVETPPAKGEQEGVEIPSAETSTITEETPQEPEPQV